MKISHTITIQVEYEDAAINVEDIDKASRLTLMVHEPGEACEVVIVLSDDEALQELNKRFRGEDRPTDVLSFEDDNRGPFSVGVQGLPRPLGDIVISVDRAREQAEAAGGTLMEELMVLTVHGTLHLLGHDHGDAAEKEQMWAIQDKILRLLGVNIALPE